MGKSLWTLQTNNTLRNWAFWEPEEGLQKIRALPGLSNFTGAYQQASPLIIEACACFSFIFTSPCTALPLLLLPQKNTSCSLLSLIHSDLNGRTEEALKTFRKGSKDNSWPSEHGKNWDFRTLWTPMCWGIAPFYTTVA